MEFLNGGDLFNFLLGVRPLFIEVPNHLPPPYPLSQINMFKDHHTDQLLLLILRLARDITDAMDYMHSLNPPIIHRDLRSPNIFVCFPSYEDSFIITTIINSIIVIMHIIIIIMHIITHSHDRSRLDPIFITYQPSIYISNINETFDHDQLNVKMYS
jgi:serine/threonine protein kinase